jgi:NAD(P)-dependent dehydrogenase (short-subunit alcohol dehydrogenase family)
VEALAHVMAADLADTPVRANVLLPGGPTATAMIPEDVAGEIRQGLLDPAVMGPPAVWLSSSSAAGVHGETIVARDFVSPR